MGAFLYGTYPSYCKSRLWENVTSSAVLGKLCAVILEWLSNDIQNIPVAIKIRNLNFIICAIISYYVI